MKKINGTLRRALAVVLTSSMLGGMLTGVRPAVAAGDDSLVGWLTEGWTVKTEEGEPVLYGDRSNHLNLLYSQTTDFVCVEFDILMEDSYGSVDGSIGPAYKMPNGYQYFFEYNTVIRQVRIRRIGPGVDSHVGPGKSMSLELNQWYHFKVMLADNNLRWYLDDQLLFTVTDTYGDPLYGGQWCIQGYNATPRIKSLRLFAESAEEFYKNWDLSGWDVSPEGGVYMLTGSSTTAVSRLKTQKSVTENAISVNMMMLDVRSTVDANIGVSYICDGGQEYFFEYNPGQKIVRVRRFADGSEVVVGTATPYEMKENEWFNIKAVVSDGHLAWYINDMVMHEIEDTHGDIFKTGDWTVQGFNSTPKISSIKLYDADPLATPEVENCDFEFTSEASIGGFMAQRGSVSYGQGARDGALVYTLNEAGSSLKSPTIAAALGTAYCARLDVKNTIFLRLKNDTDASFLRVYFKTTTLSRYTEDHSVLVPVTPHGEYESLYANFSACPDTSSYLTGFMIEPVDAGSGSITIDAISFEREKAIYDYAGGITSCIADKTAETVTIKGTLNTAYAGKTVNLYELSITNWSESVTGLIPIATVVADGESFTFTLPLRFGKLSHLSTLFMATVDGVKVSDRFQVENYRDFTENPYAFTLPSLTVNVTDAQFGALGDAFTDDTTSIQAAIDYVSGTGGGTVIVPGDDSFYGRRYIVTNIKMKDNVELRIEEGAVLWQSPRVADYTYDIVYGHDINIPGVNWTHASSCHNLPLIQGDNVKNIRVTGGGTLRSVDTGGENLDSVSGSIWTGCENRLHIIPVGFFQCENIEVSDITLLRTNGYNFNLRDCENAYVGNLTVREVTCASGDGVACTVGTKHVLIDRFTFYSNDDAVTLCSTYNDPRGIAWWHANPGDDNCVEDITVVHSNIFGGHGITFITWGTDAPDQSLQEIKDIEVYDCILSGGSAAVGAWPDNPYYGRTPFDNTETNDYSPVKEVRIHDNVYKSVCTLECISGTDIITDCGITSASKFINGSFERTTRENGWINGLSYWSYDVGEGSTVEAVKVNGNYMGKITGTGALYEGLHLGMGEHTFTIKTNLVSGTGKIFVRDTLSGETIVTASIPAGQSDSLTLTFRALKTTNFYIGAELTETGELYVDDATIKSVAVAYPDTFEESFEKTIIPTFDYTGWTTVTEDGNTFIEKLDSSEGTYKLGLKDKIGAFDLRFHLRIADVFSTVDGNVGISFCRTDSNNQYFLEYNPVHHFTRLRSFVGGAEKELFITDCTLDMNRWYQFGLRYDNGHIQFYLDGELIVDYTDSNPLSAAILTLAGYNVAINLDNITLASPGTLDMTEKASVKTEVYALYFDVLGGTSIPLPQVLRPGSGVNKDAVTTPTRTGYTFEGWMLGDAVVDLDSFTMPAEDTTLVAVWKQVENESDTETETETETDPGPVTAEPDSGTTTENNPSSGETETTAGGSRGCKSVVGVGSMLLAVITALAGLAWFRRKRSAD